MAGASWLGGRAVVVEEHLRVVDVHDEAGVDGVLAAPLECLVSGDIVIPG